MITPEMEQQYTSDLYRAIPTEVQRPEPVVQVKPEIMRKPVEETLEAGRQAYIASITRLLDAEIASVREENYDRFAELSSLREDLVKNGEKAAAMSILTDMYGAQAYAEVKRLAETSPTIQRIEEDYILSGARELFNNTINRARKALDSPNLTTEEKETIRRNIKQRFGVEL
jgi:hypothetical protein